MLEERAPSSTAEDWDNVGLLAGDPSWKTEGAVLCVDLTAEAIRVAREKKFRLIINHHPCIFPGGRGRGLSRIVSEGGEGLSSLVFDAIRGGIAIAAYHTNFDKCSLEVVDQVSRALGVTPKGRLIDHGSGSLLKLVVFVPETHVDVVREGICAAGAGHIGNYDFCTFGALGEGSFRGSESTKPFIGRPGALEKAAEIRLETVFPRGLRRQVLAALRDVHPYEEIAYDLVPVEQAPSGNGMTRGIGYGFWGDFTSPRLFPDVTKDVKRVFQLNGYVQTDPSLPSRRHRKTSVRRIAFVAGKGASFIDAAADAGCDVFVTGEAGYHLALAGARRGMYVIEIGHRESEKYFVPTVSAWCRKLGLRAVSAESAIQKWI